MVGGLFVSELSESTNRVAEFTPVMLVTLFLSKIWKVQKKKLDKNKNSSRKMCVPLQVAGVRVIFDVKIFLYF